MKKYYSARELLANKVNLSELIHDLVHSPTNELYTEAYVRLSQNENERLICNLACGDAFVRLPKKILQMMEMNLNKEEHSTKITLSHFTFKVDEGMWYRYLDNDDDVLLREQITDENLKRFSEGSFGRITLSTPLALEDEFILSRATMTTFDCDIRDIYLKSSSAILKGHLFSLQASNAGNLNLLLQNEEWLPKRLKAFFKVQKAWTIGEHINEKSPKKRMSLILKDLGHDLPSTSRTLAHFFYFVGVGDIGESEK